MVVEIKSQITWEEFVKQTYYNELGNSDYIYRGQSNSFIFPEEFIEWDLVSTFNRTYSKKNFRFNEFLSQQLNENFFKTTYGNYEFVERTNLINSNLITRLYFLQHYGIPTCLLDFTFNPLIALYFSLTSLKGHRFRSYDENGFPTIYPEDCQISIIRLNHKILQDVLKIKDIVHTSNDLFINYEHYGIGLSKQEWAYLGIDLFPLKKINSEITNFNLEAQDACFVLYDNAQTNGRDLISFVTEYCDKLNIIPEEPIFKIYKIKYNSLYRKFSPTQENYEPIFQFLEKNNVSGKVLFNDYQGLKYDLNFFHDK